MNENEVAIVGGAVGEGRVFPGEVDLVVEV
jgi:hypothetical protein